MRYLLIFLLNLTLFAQINDRVDFKRDALYKQDLIQEKRKEARWHFGIFSIAPIYGIDRLGWDSNLFNNEDQKEKDFFIAPRIGIETYLRPTPRFIWMNAARYNYVYYQEHSELRGSEYDLESRAYLLRDRFYFDGGVNYTRNQLRFNSEIDQRPFRETTSASTSMILTLKPRHKVKFDFKHDEVRFDITGDAFENLTLLEADSNAFSADYYFQLTSLTWPFLQIGSTKHNFLSDNNARDDSTFESFKLGIRTPNNINFYYIFSLGNSKVDFSKTPETNANIFTVDATSLYKLSRRTNLELSIQRNPSFSTFRSYNYYVSQSSRLGYSLRLRNNFNLVPNIELSQNNYDKPANPDELHRKDNLYKIAFEIRMPYRRNIYLSTSIGYSKRDSNILGYSDNGWEISTKLSPTAL